MNDSFGKAMDQAWSAYYALKYETSLSWMQVRQVCSNLTAALDYLAQANEQQSDADVAEVYAEAKSDTEECLAKMKALYDSMGDDDCAESAKYKDFLKLLYWL